MAALALPGLSAGVSDAQESASADLQFAQYRESERDLNGKHSKYAPIRADSMFARASMAFSDRLKLSLGFAQDTWSGATPIATAPVDARMNSDSLTGASPYLSTGSPVLRNPATRKFLNTDGYATPTGGESDRLVHTMSGASIEVRRQFDVRLEREWEEAGMSVGGGVSDEPDYKSLFANLGGRWDFNAKLTSLRLDGSVTRSKTEAMLDHDALPYIANACGKARCNFDSTSSHIVLGPPGTRSLEGSRLDWSASIGLSQVLSRSSAVDLTLGYTRSSGYLGNPYKTVSVGFIDPDQQFLAVPGTEAVFFQALLEKRPDVRNQTSLDVRYVHHVEATDGAVHLGYRYSRDDWGIDAHTLEADWTQPLGRGWSVTPRLRYYSQDAAAFYTPYMIVDSASRPKVVDPVKGQVYIDASNPDNGLTYFDDPTVALPDGINPITGNPVVDANGNPVSQPIADSLIPRTVPFDKNKIPRHYSSDHRLSGYGALSAGLTISKTFAKGVKLDFSYEYYTHAGSLKLGGGGEPDYADFRTQLLSATLRVDLDATSRAVAGQGDAHASHVRGNDGDDRAHAAHAAQRSHALPAGLMFEHMLDAGQFMVGYRYRGLRNAGDIKHGSHTVEDAQLKANGCEGNLCALRPVEMKMNMHMLEIMYAPTAWLNLMVMPQYMDMEMRSSGLLTPIEQGNLPGYEPALYLHHALHPHTSAGLGDTTIAALVRIASGPTHNLHAGVGLSIPTGDVDIKFRDMHAAEAGLMHYGMQTGSGTYDLLPSLTYTGAARRWSWGAQLGATLRLESRNDAGFAFGNVGQATAWGGYRFSDWFSATLRGVYTVEGKLRGAYRDTLLPFGPFDYARNYGGRFFDVGIGLHLAPGGLLRGNAFALEWLQPVNEAVNGYQLQRHGSLVARWSLGF